MNAYDQLEKWLSDGTIGDIHLQIAYRTAVRKNPDFENLTDLLCGKKHDGGLLHSLFQIIKEIKGVVLLAHLRGYQAGYEDRVMGKQPKHHAWTTKEQIKNGG